MLVSDGSHAKCLFDPRPITIHASSAVSLKDFTTASGGSRVSPKPMVSRTMRFPSWDVTALYVVYHVYIYIYTRTFIYIQYQYASTTKICVQTYWHTYVWEVELAQAFQCNVLSVGTQWFMEVSPAPMFTQDRRFSFMLMMWSFHTRRKYDISKMVRTWVNHWHPKAWQITTWKRTCSWRAGGYWSGVSMNILASVQWRCALQLCAGFPSGLWMIVGFGEFTWVHPGHAQLFSFSLEGQNPKGLSKRKG